MAGMVTLYVLGPLRHGLPDISTQRANEPHVVEYHLVMIAYIGTALVGLLWIGTRYGRHAARGSLRTGLWFIAAGAGLMLVVMANRLLFLLLTAADRTPPWGDAGPTGILWYFSGPAVTLVNAGLTIPRWGPRLARWHRRYHLHLQLRPLWIRMYRACHDIALIPPRPAVVEALLPYRVTFHLHRRVVEIRDALIGPLRHYLDPAVLAYSQRLAGSGPTTEAACIAVALRAHDRRQPVGDHEPAVLWSQAADLDSEAEWLASISRSVVRSPVVTTALAHTEAGATVSPCSNQLFPS